MKKNGPITKHQPSKCGGGMLNIACIIVLGWISVVYYFHMSRDSIQVQKDNESQIVVPVVSTIIPPPLDRTVPKPLPSNVKENKLAESTILKSIDPDDSIHIVFSTDCSFYQDWQTLLVFHSAMTVGQKGTITRIASGCDDVKKDELTALYLKLFPQYHVHFTPDFKMDGKTKKKYDFYNKPYGVQHWLDKAEPPIKPGVVVALLDPDMILLRPITVRLRGEANLINLYSFNKEVDVVPETIKHGVAASQLYGLGAPWATNSKNFNRTHVCGKGSPCLRVDRKFGEDHYSVGPPYILERDDLWKLTRSWTEFVPKVYERYPELLAEMYAYSMAGAHIELPHFTVHHLMVSNTFANDEGWPWVDALGDDVCEDPVEGRYYPTRPMPTTLHYCQFFRAGEIGFQKRRIRKEIFSCDKPMMRDLPRDLGKVNYKNRDGEIIPLNQQQARRNAFMLCAIHKSINSMLEFYKAKMCGPDANHQRTINVVDKNYWG